MTPVPSGARVRIIANANGHSYTVGQVYTVTQVDTDGTFRARGEDGNEGNWLRWGDCAPAGGVGWDFCRQHLPPEVVDLLSAFSNIETIELRLDVKDRILHELPDLHDRILDASRELRAEQASNEKKQNASAATNPDDDDDPDNSVLEEGDL